MIVFATSENLQEISIDHNQLVDKFDYYFFAKPSNENSNFTIINTSENSSLLLLIKASLSEKRDVLIAKGPINDEKIVNKVKPKHHVLDNDEWIYLSPSIRSKIDTSKSLERDLSFESLQSLLIQQLK